MDRNRLHEVSVALAAERHNRSAVRGKLTLPPVDGDAFAEDLIALLGLEVLDTNLFRGRNSADARRSHPKTVPASLRWEGREGGR
jgi:hypothetical protein